MDGILNSVYVFWVGEDCWNYGGLDGFVEVKELFCKVLGVSFQEILIGGNVSLMLMFQIFVFVYLFGVCGVDSVWIKEGVVKFLCFVFGYDCYFSVCEELGIEMILVVMIDQGFDMDQVEVLVKVDSVIKGIWCVF